MARRCFSAKKKALAGPMACAIHLRVTGLPVLSAKSARSQAAEARMLRDYHSDGLPGAAATVIRETKERIFAA